MECKKLTRPLSPSPEAQDKADRDLSSVACGLAGMICEMGLTMPAAWQGLGLRIYYEDCVIRPASGR